MAFDEFNQTLTGIRPSGGGYVNGVWTPGPFDPITIGASVQPSNENELKLLPEGRRVDGAYSLRSFTEIKEKDIITIYGDDYEVLKVQSWLNGVINHYLAIAVRVQSND